MSFMLGTFAWVVLPVARRMQGERTELVRRAKQNLEILPGSEPVWRGSLTADEGRTERGLRLRINRTDKTPLLGVAAGRFRMGHARGEQRSAPEHQVTLGAYLIALHPVTNSQYRQFLESAQAANHRGCHPLEPAKKSHRPAFWGKAGWNASLQPVVGVDWFDAYAYVSWAGLRLPTEAEWERAAGGTDGRRFPWGESTPSAALACQGQSHPEAVLELADGDSPVGARQMAGNVWEWCYDRFDSGYYRRSAAEDPKGPAGRGHRVVRGGSYRSGVEALQVRYRHWRSPLTRAADLGFRCAR